MSGKVSLHIEPKERLSFGQDIGCAWYLRTSASHKSKAGLKTGCNHRPPQGRRYLPQVVDICHKVVDICHKVVDICHKVVDIGRKVVDINCDKCSWFEIRE